MKIFKILALLAGFLLSSALQGQTPPILGGSAAATVRIPTHGASCTIIYTEPGRTIFLGCGHAYQGDEIVKDQFGKEHPTGRKMVDVPHGLDVPVDVQSQGYDWTSRQGNKVKAVIKLLAVDYSRDLSLVELNQGPFPFVCPVAPKGYKLGTHFIAVGYDKMEFPPKQVTIHIDGEGTQVYWTFEKPIPGRSGGGLIDIDSGCLIGVCEGYTATRGVYIKLDLIHQFLDAKWPNWNQQPRPPPQVQQPKKTGIFIPLDCRVKNKTGVQCAWASLETCARYLKIQRLYDLTDKYATSETYSQDRIAQILTQRQVKFKMQRTGNYDKSILVDAISKGLPVVFGRHQEHAMVLVDIDEKNVKILANSTDQEVHEDKLWAFLKGWDGWAVVLYPDEGGFNVVPKPPSGYNYEDVGPVIPPEKFQQKYKPPVQRPQYIPQQQLCPT